MNHLENGRNIDAGQNFVNFNQDFTCLLVGTHSGYRLYSLNSAEKLDKTYDNGDEGIRLMERLFSSSLIALVGTSTPSRLRLWHLKKGIEISSYVYPGTILTLRLNQQRLVVCLEECIYIHRTSDMQVLHIITDVAPDAHGLCALSSGCAIACKDGVGYLAYPGSGHPGYVQIFNAVDLKTLMTVQAHNNKLACVTFNSSGNLLSTASVKGTIIRVFSVSNGEKLFEFRRGVKRYATIYSLAFSSDSQYLACSSNTETVHVFKLDGRPTETSPAEEGWMDYIGKALKTSASYLPASDYLSQGRDYAVARLPASGPRNACAVVSIDHSPHLLLASSDGSLFVFSLDPLETSSQCSLVKHHRLEMLDEKYDCSLTFSSIENAENGKQSRASGKVAEDAACTNGCLEEPDGGVMPLPKWSGPARVSYASVVLKKHDDSYDWQSREEREIGNAAATDCGSKRRRSKTCRQKDASLHLDDDEEFPAVTYSKQ